MNLWIEYLIERDHLPPEWDGFNFSRAERDCPRGFMRITGAVAPLKGDGSRNWRKLDKATERVLFFRIDDFEAWRKARNDRLGKCQQCDGDGKIWRGWSKDSGNRFDPCKACDGTGAGVAQGAAQ